jgi:hypothetical protein
VGLFLRDVLPNRDLTSVADVADGGLDAISRLLSVAHGFSSIIAE